MLKVESLDHMARGIAKQENKIVFIENALKEELVDINVLKEKKNFIEAEVSKYHKKSKDRITPICPYYNSCGGCNLMHINYFNQLKFKEDKIKNIIEKYIKDDIKINSIVKSDNEYYYRNKVTFQVNGKLGFYKKHSYEIVDIDKCFLCDNVINNSINSLKKLDLNKISKIIVRSNTKDLMIIIETKFENLDITPIKEIANSIYLKINNNYKLIYNKVDFCETLDNYKFILSKDSFFQVNLNVCNKLYNEIKKEIGTNKKVLDLYCGVGSIGIFVSDENNVLGVELNKHAIECANINKDINNIKNINFICGDSGKTIDSIDFNPDVIIIDPPRSGLNKETITNILNFKSKKIIYVSCDPLTLVRDLNILKKDYTIKEITPFDMFPNTYHVETLTILEKR